MLFGGRTVYKEVKTPRNMQRISSDYRRLLSLTKTTLPVLSLESVILSPQLTLYNNYMCKVFKDGLSLWELLVHDSIACLQEEKMNARRSATHCVTMLNI